MHPTTNTPAPPLWSSLFWFGLIAFILQEKGMLTFGICLFAVLFLAMTYAVKCRINTGNKWVATLVATLWSLAIGLWFTYLKAFRV